MICPLCEKEVPNLHKRSHLIPEWMYKDVYDDKHKMINVTISKEHVNKKQKGYYNEIICNDCEVESASFDRYASLILTEDSRDSMEYLSVNRNAIKTFVKGKEQNHVIWSNIDFHKLQKFVFACILRTHISMQKEGKTLLINKHFRKIREIYKSNKIVEDTTYPILLIKLTEDDGYKNIVLMPFSTKVGNHYTIEFSGGGYTFWVFVSSHKIQDALYRASLKHDGSLYLFQASMQDSGSFKKALPKLVKLAKEFPMKKS